MRSIFLVGSILVVAVLVWYLRSHPSNPIDEYEPAVESDSAQLESEADGSVDTYSDIRRIDQSKWQEAADTVIAVISVEFPGGEAVDVALRHFEPKPPPVVGTPLSDTLDILVDAASAGDGAAARTLYRDLRRCSKRFTSREQMNTAIDQLRKTNKIQYPNGDVGNVPLGRSTVATEERIERTFEYCDGIDQGYIDNRLDWAAIAAENGDYLGTRDYALAIGSDTEEGFKLYESLWDRGYVHMLPALSIQFEKGVYPGSSGEPDRVRAYAYALVVARVLGSAFSTEGIRSELSGGDLSNLLVAMDAVISDKSSYLTVSEQEAGDALAIELLRNNENCCKGRW